MNILLCTLGDTAGVIIQGNCYNATGTIQLVQMSMNDPSSLKALLPAVLLRLPSSPSTSSDHFLVWFGVEVVRELGAPTPTWEGVETKAGILESRSWQRVLETPGA